jgi:DNA-binding transcriptional regulator GbsR (MarR family)
VAVLKPRERLVYFRISEDEFHQFVSVCEQEGARSVSDLARSAVQRLISNCDQKREAHELTPKVEQLEKLIAELGGQLQMMGKLLKHQDAVLASRAAAGADGGSTVEPGPDQQNHKPE